MEDVMEGALYDTIILFSDNSSSVSVIYEDMDNETRMPPGKSWT